MEEGDMCKCLVGVQQPRLGIEHCKRFILA